MTSPSPDGALPSKYAAFVSYRHEEPDLTEAVRLQTALEAYRIPTDRAVAPHPRRLGRVFVDRTELSSAPELAGELRSRLDESRWLLVLGSPRARSSRWMDDEVRHFRATGRGDRVVGVLLDGDPAHAFPPAVYEPDRPGGPPVEPLFVPLADARGRVTRASRRVACLRLVARMVGVDFDQLYRRDRRRRRRVQVVAALVSLCVVAALGVLAAGVRSEREARVRAEGRADVAGAGQREADAQRARERRHRVATLLAARARARADEGDVAGALDATLHARALADDADDVARAAVHAAALDLAWARGVATPVPAPAGGTPTAGALSPDGRWCAVAGERSHVGPDGAERESGFVVVADLAADPPRIDGVALPAAPVGVAFVVAESSLRLAVALPDDALQMLDPVRPSASPDARRALTPQTLVASADGGLLASEAWGWRLDAPSSMPFPLPASVANATHVAVDARGRRLAAASEQGVVRVWTLGAAAVEGKARTFHEGGIVVATPESGRLRGVAFLDGGRRLLALAVLPHELLSWDVDGSDEARAVPTRRLLGLDGVARSGLRVSPDDRFALAVSATDHPLLVALDRPGLPVLRPRAEGVAALPTQPFDATATRCLTLHETGGLVWRTDGWRLPRSLRSPSDEAPVAPDAFVYVPTLRSAWGLRLGSSRWGGAEAIGPLNARVVALDASPPTPAARVEGWGADGRGDLRAAVDPAGAWIAVATRSTVHVVPATGGGVAMPVPAVRGGVAVAWSPASTSTFAVADGTADVGLYRASSAGVERAGGWSAAAGARDVAWGGDGRLLAVVCGAAEIRVRDVERGAEVAVPALAAAAGAVRVLWAGDGATLVAWTDDGALWRWRAGDAAWGVAYRAGRPVRAVAAAGRDGLIVVERSSPSADGDERAPPVLGDPVAGDVLRHVPLAPAPDGAAVRPRDVDRALGVVRAVAVDAARGEVVVWTAPDLVEVFPLAPDAAYDELRRRGGRTLDEPRWSRIVGEGVPFLAAEPARDG